MDIGTLYKDWNDDLVSIIKYHGVAERVQGDIANDFYIKADTALKNGKAKVMYKEGNWNRQYLFSMVRNVIYANHNEGKKMELVPIDDHDTGVEDKFHESREELLERAIEEIPHYFDRRLVKVFLTEGFTIRAMAAEVGISPTTIFYSLKKSKEFIKQKIHEYEGTI